jgi:hypothetical protein
MFWACNPEAGLSFHFLMQPCLAAPFSNPVTKGYLLFRTAMHSHGLNCTVHAQSGTALHSPALHSAQSLHSPVNAQSWTQLQSCTAMHSLDSIAQLMHSKAQSSDSMPRRNKRISFVLCGCVKGQLKGIKMPEQQRWKGKLSTSISPQTIHIDWLDHCGQQISL